MRGHACGVHVHRSLVPQESHHIWPLGYHGPDTPANRVLVCANAHSDIHYLMEAMLRAHPYNLSEYGPKVRVYADAGYDQVMAYGTALSARITS